MRENPPNPADATLNMENETKPPNYSDLFSSSGSSLASTPPSYSSKTPSVENNAEPASEPEAPKKKTRKTKKQIIEEAAAALAAKKAAENKEDKWFFPNKIDEKFFHFLQNSTFLDSFFVIHSFVVKVGKAEMVL